MGMTTGINDVAKKKSAATPKRQGTFMRVSAEFSETVKAASNIEQMSAAEFTDTYLLPVAKKRYREAVLKVAKRLEGGEK